MNQPPVLYVNFEAYKTGIMTSETFFAGLREKEYSRLDTLNHVYLDFTGGNIHPRSLVEKHCLFLQQQVHGNPHSNNPTSQLSERHAQEARRSVLDFFKAADYDCIFTHNATGALQIVGECYPFFPGSHFLLTADNHNSVNGIREYCTRKGARYTYSPMNIEDLTINENELNKQLDAHPGAINKLFAFPAQSNASGVQHSLAWVQKAKDAGWDVLLDAAAFVPTSKLDLSVIRPDFISLSFYKIFGYPTGLGCLLVKRSMLDKLKRPSFAGGTISLSAVTYSAYFLKPNHERFESGTINYLDIPAITNGLQFINDISIERINSRVKELSRFFLSEINMLHHGNGRPLIRVYGPQDTENRGGNFLLNFFDVDGRQYPFQYIEDGANKEKISLRTGCFCNPGIDELNHCLSAEQLKAYFVSRESGDYFDFIQYTGKLRGAVRVSIGIPTTKTDLERFISFAKQLLDKRA